MDDVWQRDEIDSPCVKICQIHPGAGLCIGCYRTGAEIAGWIRMSREERLAIMADLPGREPQLRDRRNAPSRRTGRRRGS